MALGTIAAVVGIAGGLSGLLGAGGGGGGGGGGVQYNPFALPGSPALAQQFVSDQNLINQQATGLAGTTDPALLAILNNRLGVGAPGSAVGGTISTAQQTLPPQLQQYAAIMDALGKSNIAGSATGMGAANAVLGQAFDPQQALYDRTKGLVGQDYLAGISATGTGGSPYAAGVYGQGLSDFELNWQNALLGREATGIGAYNTALQGALGQQTQGGQQLGTSLQYGAQAPATALSLSDILNQFKMQGLGDYMSAITGNIGTIAGAQNQINPYLGLSSGVGAQQFAAGTANRNFNAQQQFGGTLGLLAGLNQGQTAMQNPNSWLNQIFAGGGGSGASSLNYGGGPAYMPGTSNTGFTGTGSTFGDVGSVPSVTTYSGSM